MEARPQVFVSTSLQNKTSRILILINVFTSYIIMGQFFLFEDSSFTRQQDEVCRHQPSDWFSFLTLPIPKSLIFSLDKIYKCQFQNQATFAKSLFFIGSILGYFLVNGSADIIGKVRFIKMGWLITLLASTGIQFATDMQQAGICLFLIGFALVPCSLLYYSVINERIGSRKISSELVKIDLSFTLGQLLVCVQYIIVRNYRYQLLVWMIGSVISLCLLNQLDQIQTDSKQQDSTVDTEELEEWRLRGVKRFFARRWQFAQLIKFSVIYMFFQIYYFIFLEIVLDRDNTYPSQAINVLCDFIAYSLVKLFIDRITAKTRFVIFSLAALTLLQAVQFVWDLEKIIQVIWIQKLICCLGWGIFLNYSIESMHASTSAASLGVFGLFSSAGSVLVPYMIAAEKVNMVRLGFGLGSFLFSVMIL